MRGLTVQQRRFLEIIEDFIAKHGFPPTVRELRDLLHVTTTNAVHERLRYLEKKGYINVDASVSRGIRVIKRPRVFIAPVRLRDGRVIFPLIGQKNDAPGLEPEASVGITNSAREGTASRSAGRAR